MRPALTEDLKMAVKAWAGHRIIEKSPKLFLLIRVCGIA